MKISIWRAETGYLCGYHGSSVVTTNVETLVLYKKEAGTKLSEELQTRELTTTFKTSTSALVMGAALLVRLTDSCSEMA